MKEKLLQNDLWEGKQSREEQCQQEVIGLRKYGPNIEKQTIPVKCIKTK